MRGSMIALAAVASLGCTEAPMFQQDGVLNAATRGVVIDEGGLTANAGMYGSTCNVNPATGWVGEDRDFPGSDEEVQDSGRVDGKEVIVVTSDRGVHVVPADGWYESTEQIDVARTDVVEARLAGDALTLLVDDPVAGCAVSFADGDTVAVDPGLCVGDPQVGVDPTTGTAWVSAGGEGTVAVTPQGTETVDPEADLSVFDPYTEMLYVAASGDTWVRGIEVGGDVAWQVDLGAPVVDVEHLGWREAASVLVDDGAADVVYTVDASTGEPSVSAETIGGAHDLVTADNGRNLALVGSDAVQFMEAPRHAPR